MRITGKNAEKLHDMLQEFGKTRSISIAVDIADMLIAEEDD